MTDLFRLRLSKVWFSLLHPGCWRPLVRGVAPSLEHREVLASVGCDSLLDVGANRGQFSLMTRLLHRGVPIHAYEPLPSEAAIYRKVLGKMAGVTLHEVALGDTSGTAELHVSRRADSSSLLPIGRLQTELYPETGEVGTCMVTAVTLDSLPEHWGKARRALLKLDVQGFELAVLRGAKQALKHCAYVYAECSQIPLYTGQALFPEVEAFLLGEGFAMTRRANEQWADGRLVQADYLFVRR